MEEASFEQWIDEGVNRSGLLGPLQEALTIGSKIPGLSQYTTLSGGGSRGPTAPTATHSSTRLGRLSAC